MTALVEIDQGLGAPVSAPPELQVELAAANAETAVAVEVIRRAADVRRRAWEYLRSATRPEDCEPAWQWEQEHYDPFVNGSGCAQLDESFDEIKTAIWLAYPDPQAVTSQGDHLVI